LAGSAGLIVWGTLRSELGNWVRPFRKAELLAKVSFVVAIVVAGGFWLSLVALKHIDAALAGPLNSTAPLFILPMSVLLMKERLSIRTIVGTAIAVGGVGLILRG
jgi:drug/metabolite transporter (DMT)-like permease